MTTTMTATDNPFDNGNPPSYYIPDGEFDATPELQRIYHRGSAEISSPTAVYAVALANAASHIRPGVLTPLGHEPNLFVGISTASVVAGGKSTTLSLGNRVLPPAGKYCDGTWQGFARVLSERQKWEVLEGKRKFPGLDLQLDSTFSIRRHLFAHGIPAAEQFKAMYDSGAIVHKQYGMEAGTYRFTVKEAIYPTTISGWLFTQRAVTEGLTTRFLFADACGVDNPRETEFMDADQLRDWKEPAPLPTPDWSTVPDGRLACPPAAKADKERYDDPSTSDFDRAMLRLRFIVATAHASLHNRTQITDDDWNWTAHPMAVSRSLAAHRFEKAQAVWTWRGKKPNLGKRS